jgi:hypothetical protein
MLISDGQNKDVTCAPIKTATIVPDTSFLKEFDNEHPELLNPDGTHRLSDKFVLWSHDHNDRGWKLSDYRKHCIISTVEEFWNVFNAMPSLINLDMWFLMREGIPPLWEAAVNKEGGSFKFRVQGNYADNTWLTLAMHLVTENMCMEAHDAQLISGISLSPKRGNYCTVSVWNLDRRHTAHAIFPSNINGVDFNMSRYEAHCDRTCG